MIIHTDLSPEAIEKENRGIRKGTVSRHRRMKIALSSLFRISFLIQEQLYQFVLAIQSMGLYRLLNV